MRFKFDSKLANRLFSTPSKKRSAKKRSEEEPLDESDDVDVAQAAGDFNYEEFDDDSSCFDRNFLVIFSLIYKNNSIIMKLNFIH